MRTPSKVEFERFYGNPSEANKADLDYEFSPCKKQLKHFFILKGRNNRLDLKEIESGYVYQWLISQDSSNHISNKLVKGGYKDAQVKAFGKPNKNRWGEEWATRMSQWVIDEALGPIEKYHHRREPIRVRTRTFHSLLRSIKTQEVDPWSSFLAFQIMDYLYPRRPVKEMKDEATKRLKKYDKTLGMIDRLLDELSDDEYTPCLQKPGIFFPGDFRGSLINVANRINLKGALIKRESSQYTKANDDIYMRVFIRQVWHWLNSIGLGSKPSVIFSLLSMPELSPYAPSTRSIESLIQKFKEETYLGNPPGIHGYDAEGPFGFSSNGQFQLRMMDTTLYR